jgi:hypothetical protein
MMNVRCSEATVRRFIQVHFKVACSPWYQYQKQSGACHAKHPLPHNINKVLTLLYGSFLQCIVQETSANLQDVYKCSSIFGVYIGHRVALQVEDDNGTAS